MGAEMKLHGKPLRLIVSLRLVGSSQNLCRLRRSWDIALQSGEDAKQIQANLNQDG